MQNNPDTGTRLGSMIFDHFIMTFIMSFLSLPFFFIGMGSFIFSGIQATHEQDVSGPFDHFYWMLIPFAVYFCKDSIGGRSIAKRVLKLQVVEHSTGQPASPLRCVVRNLLTIFWPIEVIVTLASPERRLGDRLAGTRVVKSDPAKQAKPGIKWGQVGISLLAAYAFLLIISFPFQRLISFPVSERIEFVAGTENESAATRFETLLADSLKNESVVDVLIHDQIKGHENLKYVSVIVTTEDAAYASHSTDEREEITESLLLSVFPEGTFVGRVQYLSKSEGSTFLYTHRFDWREEE